MSIQPLDIAMHVVNIAVLYVLLRIILYKPVRSFMQKRDEMIAGQLKEAEKAKAEAEKLNADFKAQMKGADQKIQQKLIEGTKQAGDQAGELIAAAKVEADGILSKAHQQADQQRKEVIAQMRPQISEMAVSLAGQILKREVSALDNKKVIEAFFEKDVQGQ